MCGGMCGGMGMPVMPGAMPFQMSPMGAKMLSSGRGGSFGATN